MARRRLEAGGAAVSASPTSSDRSPADPRDFLIGRRIGDRFDGLEQDADLAERGLLHRSSAHGVLLGLSGAAIVGRSVTDKPPGNRRPRPRSESPTASSSSIGTDLITRIAGTGRFRQPFLRRVERCKRRGLGNGCGAHRPSVRRSDRPDKISRGVNPITLTTTRVGVISWACGHPPRPLR